MSRRCRFRVLHLADRDLPNDGLTVGDGGSGGGRKGCDEGQLTPLQGDNQTAESVPMDLHFMGGEHEIQALLMPDSWGSSFGTEEADHAKPGDSQLAESHELSV